MDIPAGKRTIRTYRLHIESKKRSPPRDADGGGQNGCPPAIRRTPPEPAPTGRGQLRRHGHSARLAHAVRAVGEAVDVGAAVAGRSGPGRQRTTAPGRCPGRADAGGHRPGDDAVCGQYGESAAVGALESRPDGADRGRGTCPSSSSGQGASLAAESAVELARCLRDPPLPRAPARYEELRRPRVERIVRETARTNARKAAGPVGRMVRDALLPVMFKPAKPEKNLWQFRYPIDFDAPVGTAGTGTAGPLRTGTGRPRGAGPPPFPPDRRVLPTAS